jgi:predicted amidohydrolase YtcJ
MRPAILALCLLPACGAVPPPQLADTIYHGGTILTVDADGRRAEALAVAGRRILAVGSAAEVMLYRGPETTVLQLGERALVPGFVEAHGVLLRRADPSPEVVAAASAALARVGLTTIQEGAASPAEVHLLTEVANALRLAVDAVVFPRYEGIDALGEELEDMDCVGTCRIGGIALAAEAALPAGELVAQVRRCLENGWHLHVTLRGAADVAALLAAVRAAAEVRAEPSPRIVAIVETGAVADADLAAMAELGVIPSFATLAEGAPVEVAVRAARVPGLRFTLHDAALDRLPDPLASITAAVAAGMDPDRALAAWTRDAAWQIRMEGRKGSLEVGKLADLVILSADPTDPAAGPVEVVATVKSGATIFVAD